MFALNKIQDNDDTTTAFSSWIGDDDLSSCTERDETSNSSDMDPDFDYKDIEDVDELSPTKTLQLAIISERAAMLLRRERSMEYGVGYNYCSYDTTEPSWRMSRRQSDLNSAADRDETSANSLATTGSSPEIDLDCRSRMMEWAINVVEFSYPPPSTQSSTSRKHSVETLQIISTAFSYVDRIMSQSRSSSTGDNNNSNNNRTKALNVLTRKDYKLLCMVCLHLAAKMSGLFSRGGEEYQMKDSSQNEKTERTSSNSSLTSVCTATTTFSSPNSSSDTDGEHPSDSPTTHSDKSRHNIPRHKYQPRPLLQLLSFQDLETLCQGEFSIKEMCEMELSILCSLEWRLNGGLVLEWLNLVLESMVYCRDYGLASIEELGHLDVEEVKENALVQLEAIIKSHELTTRKPSALALAAFSNAMKLSDVSKTFDDDCSSTPSLSFLQVLGVSCEVDEIDDAMAAMK